IAAAVVDLLVLLLARRCEVRRECLPVLSLGVENLITITFENNANVHLHVRLKDEPPPSFEQHGRECNFTVTPWERWEGQYRVVPTERGDYRFGNLNVRLRTRIGLLELQLRYPIATEVKVYPNVLQTRKHELLARRNRLLEMGLKRSRMRGEGTEFEALRDYVPDDEFRRIDWKATARRGKPISKDYELERHQNVVMLLDAGRIMANRLERMTKLDHAINACAFLAYVAVQADDHVGLLVFADEILSFVPPAKGRRQFLHILEGLYRIQPRLVEANYRLAFTYLAGCVKRRSLIILFTDLIDPDSSELIIQHAPVLARSHVFLCVALSDYELREMLDMPPHSMDDVYQQAVAVSILEDRLRAVTKLSQMGAVVLDTNPKSISVDTVNKYLEIKRRL
ncbi:MAG TPA: DUF58 domain-containing protein, partial [Armatimonadetes bacterium]|nr:DUF58 domain-containing protein [Armatimonadota bacterium]